MSFLKKSGKKLKSSIKFNFYILNPISIIKSYFEMNDKNKNKNKNNISKKLKDLVNNFNEIEDEIKKETDVNDEKKIKKIYDLNEDKSFSDKEQFIRFLLHYRFNKYSSSLDDAYRSVMTNISKMGDDNFHYTFSLSQSEIEMSEIATTTSK